MAKLFDAIVKAVDPSGFVRVQRREWTKDVDVPWAISVDLCNNQIWWSHTLPMTPWIPKADDLVATDWRPLPKQPKTRPKKRT